jgi:transposase
VARQTRSEIRGPGGAFPLSLGDRAAQDFALLIEAATSGRPLNDVLADFHCSRSSYYEKLSRFREGGLAGLLPKPPGPRGPRRRTIEVVRFIVRARLQHPQQSATSIAEELKARGMGVSVRSVERTLSQFGLTSAGGRR